MRRQQRRKSRAGGGKGEGGKEEARALLLIFGRALTPIRSSGGDRTEVSPPPRTALRLPHLTPCRRAVLGRHCTHTMPSLAPGDTRFPSRTTPSESLSLSLFPSSLLLKEHKRLSVAPSGAAQGAAGVGTHISETLSMVEIGGRRGREVGRGARQPRLS